MDESSAAKMAELKKQHEELMARANASTDPVEKAELMSWAEVAKSQATSIYEKGTYFGPGDFLKFGLQGATLGTSDEIAAAVSSPFTDNTYRQNWQESNDRMDLLREKYPALAYGSEAIGAFALPGAALVRGAQQAPNLARAAGSLMGRGGAMGAVGGAGYSTSPPGEDFGGFVGDVAAGGGIGALATPAIGLGLPLATTTVSRAVQRLAQEAGTTADQLITEISRRTSMTPSMIQARLNELGPEATLADVSPALRDLASASISASDEAANQAGYYATRQAGAKNRIVGAGEDMTESVVGDYQRVMNDVSRARRADADRLYPAVSQAQIPASTVDSLIKTPLGSPAFERAVRNWETRNRRPFNREPDGLSGDYNIPLEILDDMKQILDKEAKRVSAGQTGGTPGIYMELAQDLVSRLDELVPDYATARGSYQAHSRVLEAGETGRNIKHNQPFETTEEIAKTARDYNANERRQLARGYLERLYEDVTKSGGARGTGFAGTRLGPQETRAPIQEVIAPSPKVQAFDEVMDREGLFNETFSYLNPTLGSKTSGRADAAARLEGSTSIPSVVASSLPTEARTLVNVLRSVGHVPQDVAEQLARRLMKPNLSQQELDAMLNSGQLSWSMLEELQSNPSTRMFLQGVGGTTGTGILSDRVGE